MGSFLAVKAKINEIAVVALYASPYLHKQNSRKNIVIRRLLPTILFIIVFYLGTEYEWKQFDKHNSQLFLNPGKIRNFRLEEYSHVPMKILICIWRIGFNLLSIRH